MWILSTDDTRPDSGETSFLVDADPQVFGSGAAVSISYERNTELPDCAENTALDGTGGGMDDTTIDLILSQVEIKPGWRTNVTFRTLLNGPHVEPHMEPFHRGAQVLPNPVPLPSVSLSSLRCTHRLVNANHIFLVHTGLDPPSHMAVFKTSTGLSCQSSLIETVEFMARIPDIDVLLRPTHIVLDEGGRLHGFLSNHHPASSLRLTMKSLHPDATPLMLPPLSGDEDAGCLLVGTTKVTWPVKLVWAIDIAASMAWLHAQSIFWGDLKTDNIVLCTDGRCRLIDYCPGGRTTNWCPPEAAKDERVTAQGDVFSLGLVLWAVVSEVVTFKRKEDYVAPLLGWSETTPRWFRDLVSSCIDQEPGRRPSTRQVYDTLLAHTST
ncbi:kinase-like domain-containing protein [Mycena galopus ATCC 62051]|nr:kinase-like domain-containing protein [Mycena galopus ATCC 62051]